MIATPSPCISNGITVQKAGLDIEFGIVDMSVESYLQFS